MSRKILKAYPHLEELDNYSLRVLELVIKAFPTWGGYAQVEEFMGYKYLEIKIPAPYKPTDHDLMINTSSGDLTVYFDRYHAHFGRFCDTPEEAFKYAAIFINSILKEDFIAAIKMADGKWASSRGCMPQTLHEIKPGD